MADDNPTRGSEPSSSGPRPSWHEREIALALQRLATARERLATLEERASVAPPVPEPAGDPADVAKAHEIVADIDALRPKAASRFGGGAARSRIDELEVNLHLVLDRLGVASYDELVRRLERPSAAAVPSVDADALRFAQREFEDAERSFLEVAAMVIPPNEPEETVDDTAEPEHEAEILRFKVDPAAS